MMWYDERKAALWRSDSQLRGAGAANGGVVTMAVGVIDQQSGISAQCGGVRNLTRFWHKSRVAKPARSCAANHTKAPAPATVCAAQEAVQGKKFSCAQPALSGFTTHRLAESTETESVLWDVAYWFNLQLIGSQRALKPQLGQRVVHFLEIYNSSARREH